MPPSSTLEDHVAVLRRDEGGAVVLHLCRGEAGQLGLNIALLLLLAAAATDWLASAWL